MRQLFALFQYILRVFWNAGSRLIQSRYTYRVSALAFTTVLSLVPLLSVFVYFITIFPVFTKLINLTQNYLFANFVPSSRDVIQKYLEQFTHQAASLPMLGIVFSVVTTITLIITVEHALNDVWQVRRKKKQIFIWLFFLILLLFIPLVVGMSLLLSTDLVSWFFGEGDHIGLQILPLLINTFLFSLLYTIVPNKKVGWGEGLSGGLVAAILFEIGNKGFAFYTQQFHGYELIYGTLSTIPIFLLWVYISWLIILFGAMVTYELQKSS